MDHLVIRGWRDDPAFRALTVLTEAPHGTSSCREFSALFDLHRHQARVWCTDIVKHTHSYTQTEYI